MVEFVPASRLYDVECGERVDYEWPTVPDGVREGSS